MTSGILGMCAPSVGERGFKKFILVEFASKSKNCNSLDWTSLKLVQNFLGLGLETEPLF
jgi:hypothetical protein